MRGKWNQIGDCADDLRTDCYRVSAVKLIRQSSSVFINIMTLALGRLLAGDGTGSIEAGSAKRRR